MAKRNYSAENLIASVKTGLDGEEAAAFLRYCQSELGAIKAMAGDDVFAGLTLKGKADEAKGTYNGAKIEFKGGHNTATIVMHFAGLVLKQADSLGIVPPVVDVSEYCSAWAERRRKAAKATPAPESQASK